MNVIKLTVSELASMKIPKGTTIYEGPVGYQGGIYIKCGNQIFVPTPWNIKGVQVLGKARLP